MADTHTLLRLRRAGILLGILVLSFATLVPGGPIETRDFSGLDGSVFWGFNAFLVALGLVAVTSAVALLKGADRFVWPAIAACWGYIFVVLLDLGGVFPRSPDVIPVALGVVEILDLMLAFYVLVLCHRALEHF